VDEQERNEHFKSRVRAICPESQFPDRHTARTRQACGTEASSR
jgi:hypothetical protein